MTPRVDNLLDDLKAGNPQPLEKTEIALGFIPLTDCAPLAVAQEKGFFEARGLRVKLCREPSWSNIRDKVCFDLLDGSQMLAAMPLAISSGAEAVQMPMVTGFSLSLNGNGITVSNGLYQRLLDAGVDKQSPVTAASLKKVLDTTRPRHREPLRFATVYPFSSHNYLLRYWLAAAGIDPDRDLRIVVIPPPLMVESLRKGLIDGYCVGEPWNSVAVQEGIGRVLISSGQIWNSHPEKVFAVTEAWAKANPHTHQAILLALLEACIWLDQPKNRPETAEILSRPEYVGISSKILEASLLGQFGFGQLDPVMVMPDFHVFHRYAANFPWLSHAEWILAQMVRWGQLPLPVDLNALAASVYRPDLYRQTAKILGLDCPPFDRKSEGSHEQPWLLATSKESFILGPDRFFDGQVFDPAQGMAKSQNTASTLTSLNHSAGYSHEL